MKTTRTFYVQAPSNIAIVKYMGKEDSSANLPSNGSLSMTLSGLATHAVLRVRTREVAGGESSGFRWCEETTLVNSLLAAGSDPRLSVPKMDDKGRLRIEKHAAKAQQLGVELLQSFGIQVIKGTADVVGEFCAGNTFPASSGIASSASSFAAITLGVVASLAEKIEDFEKLYSCDLEFRRKLAEISRQGSGSSCRSFEGPWVKWEGQRAESVPHRLPELTDFVIVVGKTPKEVSSSEAHLRVKGSPLWGGRTARVQARLARVEGAVREGDLVSLARESWDELWEMHSLFHTSQPPFSYWLPESLAVLRELSKWVLSPASIGLNSPLVATMDAGPNLHCLVRTEEAAHFRGVLKKYLAEHLPQAEILEDPQGGGATVRLLSSLNGGLR